MTPTSAPSANEAADGRSAGAPHAVGVEPWHVPPPPEFIECRSPSIDVDEVPLCPVCGHDRFSPFAVGFDYELRTCRNPWRFVRCGSSACSHVWLNPRPAVSTLPIIYPPHYYAYHYDETVASLALRAKNWMDQRKFAGLAATLARPPRSFADIGCGDGRYLRFARAAGVPDRANFGLELDDATVARLVAQGFVGVNSRVEDCTLIAPNSLDLCTMFHVIEHVDDPAKVVRQLAQWIAPGGVLAIETPNLDSLDARLFARTYWGGYHIPRHWNLFTPATLARLMSDAGLEVLDTRFQTGHSFWLYSMHHLTRYAGASRPALSRVFDPFAGLAALPALVGFTAFDKLRIALGSRTSSMLMLARRP